MEINRLAIPLQFKILDMKAEKNKVVAVSYELRLEKGGEVIDSATAERALAFIFGSGMMLQKFEDNLEGLEADSEFEFMLTSEEGYGAYNEQNVSEIPLDVFMQDGKIQDGLLAIGNVIPLQDNKGNHFNGKVISVSDSAVKLDFNHPLAGKDLYFTGKVIEVREAAPEEISHGHVHQHGHHHHHHHDENHTCDGSCH